MQKNRPRAAQIKFSTPWTDRLSRLRLDHSRAVGILCLACLVGALWMMQGRGSVTQGQASSQTSLSQYDLKIQGEVLGLSPIQLKEARVTLYFPQMPFQLTRRWEQLEHPKPSSFLVPLQMKAPASASLCELRLQIRDKVVQGGKVQIEATARQIVLPSLQVRL